MATVAGLGFKRYTDADYALAHDLVRREASLEEACDALRRTPAAVANLGYRRYSYTAWLADYERARLIAKGGIPGKNRPYRKGEVAQIEALIKQCVSLYDAAEITGRPARGLSDYAYRNLDYGAWRNELNRSAWRHRQRHPELAAPDREPQHRVTSRHKSSTAEIVEHTFCGDMSDAQTVALSIPQTYMGGDHVNTHIFRRRFGHYGKWVSVVEKVAA